MTEEKEDNYYTGPSSLSPIPLHIGSPPIKAEDRNLIKTNAVEAMHHYAKQEIEMLRRQADLIMQQVREIEERMKISEQIYQSDLRYQPVVNQVYHLYEKGDHYTLSLIAPDEWGRGKRMKYIASVKLLGDHSWQVIAKGEETKTEKI